jgi:hypothetical protein
MERDRYRCQFPAQLAAMSAAITPHGNVIAGAIGETRDVQRENPSRPSG